MLRLAFDIGGTFTDYVLQDRATGRFRIWKAPAFYGAYRREYGFVDPDATVETTDWYVVAALASAHSAGVIGHDAGAAGPAVIGEREAYFPELGGIAASKVVDRYRMRADDEIAGPCLVEERESTTVVLPRDVVRVDQLGHLVIEIDPGQRDVR